MDNTTVSQIPKETTPIISKQGTKKREIEYNGRTYQNENEFNKKKKIYILPTSQKALSDSKEIEQREYKVVESEDRIITKLLKELTKAKIYPEKNCCESFWENFTEAKVKFGINSASVRGSYQSINKDWADSGNLNFGTFHTVSAPYEVIAELRLTAF